MGLDMYLNADRYISNYFEDDKPTVNAIQSTLTDLGVMKVKGITAEAAYWRKANHIHNWFVINCQDGVDECQTTPVDREQLQDLLDTVTQVLDNHGLARELLPTQSGFFFGGTDYDEYYFQDLEYTKERITLLLGDEYRAWDFSYRSSW